MILRITAVSFVVCWWCAAQATQDSEELDRRLRLVDAERLGGRLAAAESMLADVQAAIERAGLSGLLLAGALKEHGLLRDDEERPAEAIPFYERALAIVRAKPAAGPVTAALLLANLASSHAECGDSDLALSLSAEALTLLQGGVESTNPAFAAALYAHGVALHSLARNTEALRDLREALEIWRHAPDPDSAQLALTNEAIAGCLSDFGYNNLAEASEREALAIRGTIGEPDSPAVGASLNNLGVILAREQKWSDGMQSLEESAMIFEQLGETGQRRLTIALGNLGALYFNQARNSAHLYARAEQVYRRKLAIEERMFGVSDVRVSATLEMLGEILYREHSYNEAGRVYGRGLAIQQSAFGPSDPKTQAAAKRFNALAKKMKAKALP